MRTPLRHSAWLSSLAASDVYLKLETLQPSFSFKIRGAWNAALALDERGDTSPLVTASAGNHGRAFAHATKAIGRELRVYVPITAPRLKVDAIRSEGATVLPCADVRRSRATREAGRAGVRSDLHFAVLAS